MSIEIVKNIEEKILSLNTTDLIKYILENHNNVALSSSLGSEDQVLTDMMFKVNKNSLILDLEFKLIFFIFVCSSKYEKSLVGTNERVQ